MSKPVVAHPSICLNMIVRNEAHIVHEVLDATAPYISSWVIVDTGSTDGTQDVIKDQMARLGIPGELHERPWVDFGHNRTEALTLAQGHGEYIWVMDADDTIAGEIDLTGLTADVYLMQFRPAEAANTAWWRAHLFRDGVPVRYEGAIHEQPVYDGSPVIERLNGNCHIVFRKLGGRDREQDLKLLLAAVERNPQDSRSTYYLGMAYIDAGDYANAQKWLARRVEMGGPDQEEVYLALFHIATVKARRNEPWPELRSALTDAWEFRPGRAKPLYFIAAHYRAAQQYRAGYQIATLAAHIPRPERDTRLVYDDIYAFRATEEQLACAVGLGNHAEAFGLSRNLLARTGIPGQDRRRIAHNRDVYAPVMIKAAVKYPELLAQRLRVGQGEPRVLVSLIAGPDLASTESALNSFLNSCNDVTLVGRFLALDAGLSPTDRATLQKRHGFLEFTDAAPDSDTADDRAQLEHIRARVNARYWLHLGEAWRFFAPDNLITRLIAILAAEPDVARVGINYTGATRLTGNCAPEEAVRRAPGTGRYLVTNEKTTGPTMFDTTRPDQTGTHTATLDEVLCIATPQPSRYITL